MLRAKQRSSNADWVAAWDGIQNAPEFYEVDAIADRTVDRISRAAKLYPKAAFAWSAGKESLVLERLCRRAGVCKGVMVTDSELEYPEVEAWVHRHLPEGVELVDAHLGFAFLKAHPDLLFPKVKDRTRVWGRFHHKHMPLWYARNGLDVLFLGRRKGDGNFIRGTADNCFSHVNGKGMRVANPMADWKSEHVLAFLKKHMIPLPPTYSYPGGWVRGTHEWSMRTRLASQRDNWAELYSFVPEVVEKAALHLDGARAFLQSIQKPEDRHED